jgi:hypothetical protein
MNQTKQKKTKTRQQKNEKRKKERTTNKQNKQKTTPNVNIVPGTERLYFPPENSL